MEFQTVSRQHKIQNFMLENTLKLDLTSLNVTFNENNDSRQSKAPKLTILSDNACTSHVAQKNGFRFWDYKSFTAYG